MHRSSWRSITSFSRSARRSTISIPDRAAPSSGSERLERGQHRAAPREARRRSRTRERNRCSSRFPGAAGRRAHRPGARTRPARARPGRSSPRDPRPAIGSGGLEAICRAWPVTPEPAAPPDRDPALPTPACPAPAVPGQPPPGTRVSSPYPVDTWGCRARGQHTPLPNRDLPSCSLPRGPPGAPR